MFKIGDLFVSKSAYDTYFVTKVFNDPVTLEVFYTLKEHLSGFCVDISERLIAADYQFININAQFSPKPGSGFTLNIINVQFDLLNYLFTVTNNLNVTTTMDPKTFVDNYEEMQILPINNGFTQFAPSQPHHIPIFNSKYKVGDNVPVDINGVPLILEIIDVLSLYNEYAVRAFSHESRPVFAFKLPTSFLDSLAPVSSRPFHISTGHKCEDNWAQYHGFTESYEYCKICDKRK